MPGETTIEGTPESNLHLAQLDKVQLENEKLKLELAEMRRAKPWYQIPIELVPIITTLVAIVGFLYGVFQYRDQQSKNRETAEREFMKPWLESQREIYLQALAAASMAANTNDPEKRTQATEEFWRLYHGKMILVETKSVAGAMGDFGKCLSGENQCSRDVMNARCRALGTAMTESMAATAEMTFQGFKKTQFQYKSPKPEPQQRAGPGRSATNHE